jgi:hypothetical protein
MGRGEGGGWRGEEEVVEQKVEEGERWGGRRRGRGERNLWEREIVDGLDVWVGAEELINLDGVNLTRLHSQRHRLRPPQHQPRVKRC